MAISRDRVDFQKERVDLVKRLFAVAFSFGLAGRIRELYDNPTSDDITTVVRLITGVIFVVICWDWFHKDIKKDIENNYYSSLRFLLDVIITLAYMTLLYISNNNNCWLFMLFVIFLLFLVWDTLAILELQKLPKCYDKEVNDLHRVMLWAIYFGCLWAIQASSPDLSQSLFSCLFVFLGIAIVRYEVNIAVWKWTTDTWKDTWVGRCLFGCPFVIRSPRRVGNAKRIIIIIFLLLLYFLFENFELFVKLLFKNFELLVKGS